MVVQRRRLGRGHCLLGYTPGQFTYFFLAGTIGILRGLSTEFVSRAYNINEEEAHLLVNSQTGVLIVKLEEGINMPQPCKDNTKEGLVANIDEAVPDVAVKNDGLLSLITSENFPVLGQIGLSASLAKLEANAMLAPMYTADSSVQMVYVSSGSGRVQMVGFNGQNALDTKVQAGKLFVVPKFVTVSVIAEGEGMECFSILTSSK
ncbi:unnamed protein product [Ilex paraguariensis]|uniref:Cupin type-1 domain-containing protein n=1 Tax=Ilex paraguariensis TaxID=185542 RepID=A0ABC8RQJ6_9AQUA